MHLEPQYLCCFASIQIYILSRRAFALFDMPVHIAKARCALSSSTVKTNWSETSHECTRPNASRTSGQKLETGWLLLRPNCFYGTNTNTAKSATATTFSTGLGTIFFREIPIYLRKYKLISKNKNPVRNWGFQTSPQVYFLIQTTEAGFIMIYFGRKYL